MNVTEKFPRYAATANLDPESWLFCWLHMRDFLIRHWRLIILMTGLAVASGAAKLSVTPSQYTAQADLLIDNKKVTWIRSEMTTEDRMVDDPSVETAIETIMSEKIATAVARRLHLDEDQEFTGPENSLWHRILTVLKFNPGLGPGPQSVDDERMHRVLTTLRTNLQVTRLGRSYVELISYTSLDSEKAAKIANAFADAYIEDQVRAKFETTLRASVWLEQRVDELRQQASDAYKAVQDFKSQNNLIVGADSKLVSEVELDKLSEALAKTRSDTSQARARLERIEHVLEQRNDNAILDIPDPVVADALNNSPVVTKLRQQFLDDQTKEAEWSNRYGSDHQAAKKLRAEMAALQRAIWDEISRIGESYKSALQIAKTQEDSIEKRIVEVFQESATTRQQQVKLRELQTAADTYRKIYETFLIRFAQAVKQQSFPSTEAQVLRQAAAGWQTSPSTSQMLELATVYGLGIAFMAAFARERMNRRIYTRAQLEELTGKSCLAILPTFTENRLLFRKQGRKSEALAFRQINGAAQFSETAEALRFIKVAIDLHQAGGNVIGIVSALPGEGKTTVAAGLAAFVANNGNHTLLIDGDLRNPSMSRTLGRTDEPGLINDAARRSSFDDLIISDPTHKFDFLPASTRIRPPNSQDILNSPAMAQTLHTARNRYDYVIIDLPPILPVVDVKAAAHLFDAFVLIVEWGSTSADDILGAMTASPILSERLIGSVLNKADKAAIRRA
jgi:polysaccharide biosynthesis transport protein